VLDYLAATDAGRILNPQLYEQQVQGGIVQGLGYALSEDYPAAEGRALTPNLPPTSPHGPGRAGHGFPPVETVEQTGPYGQKGWEKSRSTAPCPVSNAWPTPAECGFSRLR
jgi:CO/xanthine dehydrogenase Mo-binding subunit